MKDRHLHHLQKHSHLNGAFGSDTFGRLAEKIARFFGTPKYIISQSIIVILWIIFNTSSLIGLVHFDKYPFILLNLAFSTQAAYAAPLILLAQTRQADRDKAHSEATAAHAQELADNQVKQIDLNTELTKEIHSLAVEIREILSK